MAKKKLRPDDERNERIAMEIIVDAYGPEEQAMGWYYYLEEKLRFPFAAQSAQPHPSNFKKKSKSSRWRLKRHAKRKCSS